MQESAELARLAKQNGDMVANSVASTEQAMIDTNVAMGRIEEFLDAHCQHCGA